MILAWLIYATVVSSVLALAARLGEGALRAGRGSTRFSWAAGLILSAAIPPGGLALGPWLADSRAAWLSGELPGALARSWSGAPGAAGPGSPVWLDVFLLSAWGAATAALLTSLGLGWLRLRAERDGWRRSTVGSMSVLVSPDTGPATVGIWRPEIVIPRPVERLPDDDAGRRMILRHELEHVLARDGLLALGAFVLAALFPWNAAMWWMRRRLLLAQEIDCDRRVLAAGIAAPEYAELLVASARGPRRAFVGVPGLVRRSTLRRRLAALVRPEPGGGRLRAAGVAAPCLVLVGLAAAVPAPVGGTLAASRGGAATTGLADAADLLLREWTARLESAGRSGVEVDPRAVAAGIRRLEARLETVGTPRPLIDHALHEAERLAREHLPSVGGAP
ncbi:MAG: M56 family metallopeptidase [Gemmatimonadota bacterium]|nr:M56 family metallopeptidase [Gemmatimonadota bacterium]